MTESKSHTAMLHYSAPPVIGGVEGVMQAHAGIFEQMGYPLTIIAGRGKRESLPAAVELRVIPEMDTRQPEIIEITSHLKQGSIPPSFEPMVDRLVDRLASLLPKFDNLIVHNVFTKQYNLPLSTALYRLLEQGKLPHSIAWCHDIAWTSENSRKVLHPGYPWDLLKSYRPELTYVVVSKLRKSELSGLFNDPPQEIKTIYNGVDPEQIYGLSSEGLQIIRRLDVFSSDLIMLMPVRVTRLKNTEYAMQLVAKLKQMGIRPLLIQTGPPDPHDENSINYFHKLLELRTELDVEAEVRFIYSSGPRADEGYSIDLKQVADLYRVADLLLMPSHSEGFGMPVLEAGLLGLPVFSTPVPAADEIGQADIHPIDLEQPVTETARAILAWSEENQSHRLKRKVRQQYTWEAIFKHQIQPLLHFGSKSV